MGECTSSEDLKLCNLDAMFHAVQRFEEHRLWNGLINLLALHNDLLLTCEILLHVCVNMESIVLWELVVSLRMRSLGDFEHSLDLKFDLEW